MTIEKRIVRMNVKFPNANLTREIVRKYWAKLGVKRKFIRIKKPLIQ